MNVFITGMAGFAGRHLAAHCLACGDRVAGVSQSGAWEGSPNPPQDTRLQREAILGAWDIRQPADERVHVLARHFAPDAIVHLAAVSKASDCAERPDRAVAVNVAGTKHVLDLAASLPARPRVVFVSTSYVYDFDPAQPAAAALHEDAPLARSPGDYARSKLQGEALLRDYVRETGAGGVVVRAFQHAGPGQAPQFMLAEWCAKLLETTDEPLVVQRDHAWLDLSDVRDVVRAYRLLAMQGANGATYNVGRGTLVRSGAIAEQLLALAGSRRALVAKDSAAHYGPAADITRLTVATGWRSEISLEQTIADTWHSYSALAVQREAR